MARRETKTMPTARVLMRLVACAATVWSAGVLSTLAAEYTLVDNIFTTPLPEKLVEELSTQSAGRLDGPGRSWPLPWATPTARGN